MILIVFILNGRGLFAQDKAFPLSVEWKSKQDYAYSQFHIYLVYGNALHYKGDADWEGLKKQYPEMPLGDDWALFYIPPNLFSMGIDLNLNRRWKLGGVFFPGNEFSYSGAKRIAAPGSMPNAYQSTTQIKEDIHCKKFSLNVSYTLLPYKQLRRSGIDLNARLGLLLCSTSIQTYMTYTHYSLDSSNFSGFGPHYYYRSDKRVEMSYYDFKKGLGLHESLDFGWYLGKHFSIFGQLQFITCASTLSKERMIESSAETVTLPSYRFHFSGSGLTLGIAFHLAQNRSKQ
ncbi:MAG TPA: hypothetical protein PLQ93_00870 [Bacteroidia bacterium]|nr:hypothetical protein [Bacteroidia bacterium]